LLGVGYTALLLCRLLTVELAGPRQAYAKAPRLPHKVRAQLLRDWLVAGWLAGVA
jgi:hypothetical protein